MGWLDIRNDRGLVDIACNDPDNGLFAGRAERISIGDQVIELAARRDPAPRFVEVEDGFRLAGKMWRTYGSKYGVGNWYWNGYWMAVPDIARFVAWLHGRRLYHCDLGELRIFNMWRLDRPFDAQDVAFLDRYLGKPSSWGRP